MYIYYILYADVCLCVCVCCVCNTSPKPLRGRCDFFCVTASSHTPPFATLALKLGPWRALAHLYIYMYIYVHTQQTQPLHTHRMMNLSASDVNSFF